MATIHSLLAFVSLLSVIEIRANAYIGGVPLRTPGTCPVGSVVGQVTFEQNCCGADQTFVKVEGSVCCPDSTDCYSEVVAAPQCADPSWQLCGTNSGGFCCEADWVCYTQIAAGTVGAGVGCSTPGATLTSGLQSAVVTVYAANAGPGASTPSSAHPSLTSISKSASLASASGTTTNLGGGPASSTSSPAAQSEVTTGSGAVKGTTTFSSSSAPTGSSSGGSNQTSSPDSSISATKKSSISGGAIAGIAIGAAILLGAAFVGGVWFSRRKNRSDPLPSSNPSRDSIWGKWKTAGGVSELGSSDRGAELQGNVPGEGNHRGMSELPAFQQPVEMYAGYKR